MAHKSKHEIVLENQGNYYKRGKVGKYGEDISCITHICKKKKQVIMQPCKMIDKMIFLFFKTI